MDQTDWGKESVILPSALAEEMIAHARAGAPNEVCGVVAGENGAISAVYPVANRDPDPRRYLMDPKGLLHAMLDCERHGRQVLGFYHSHPTSPPLPSRTDLALAFYPDHYYAIISLRNPARPEICFFMFRDGRFVQAAVLVPSGEAVRPRPACR